MKLFAVVLLCMTAVLPVCARDGLLKSADVDLNGDGTKERVSITITGDRASDYVLRVGQASVKGELYDNVDGFTIVDIDSADKYKEIAVHKSGPSDDHASSLYWYDGKRIKETATVEGIVEFPGNCTVLADTWQGFWVKRSKYVLDPSNRKLKTVPQDLYWVDLKDIEVVKSFPIVRSRTDSSVIANLRPGSKIIIVAYGGYPPNTEQEDLYMEGWYLIKSATNLMGWAKLRTFEAEVKGLPCAG